MGVVTFRWSNEITLVVETRAICFTNRREKYEKNGEQFMSIQSIFEWQPVISYTVKWYSIRSMECIYVLFVNIIKTVFDF